MGLSTSSETLPCTVYGSGKHQDGPCFSASLARHAAIIDQYSMSAVPRCLSNFSHTNFPALVGRSVQVMPRIRTPPDIQETNRMQHTYLRLDKKSTSGVRPSARQSARRFTSLPVFMPRCCPVEAERNVGESTGASAGVSFDPPYMRSTRDADENFVGSVKNSARPVCITRHQFRLS